MKVWVYNREMRLQGIIENHTSLIWSRKLYTAGKFEIHAPATVDNLELLRPGNIITKGDKDEAAVIRGLENEESTVLNEITRTGYFMPIYFNDRLTGPTINFNGTAEEALYMLAHTPEIVPRMAYGALQGYTEKVEFQATYKNTLSHMEKIARASGLGFRVVPDFKEKILTYEVYRGKNRTEGQRENPQVIFSETYNNLNRTKYTYNDELYKTKVIVGGDGEGKNRAYVTVGGGSGLDLREVFLDAKDINREEMTQEQYLAALRARGEEYLKTSCQIAECFESEAEAEVNFTYKQDYDLGDIVTVKKKNWKITTDLRITELKEVYEYGGMFVVPTFGDAIPETINWDT
jgi:hypothetical protein